LQPSLAKTVSLDGVKLRIEPAAFSRTQPDTVCGEHAHGIQASFRREQLIATHDGLSEAQSQLVNAKLVLLLANHIGDLDVLKDALAKARGDRAMPPEASDATQRGR